MSLEDCAAPVVETAGACSRRLKRRKDMTSVLLGVLFGFRKRVGRGRVDCVVSKGAGISARRNPAYALISTVEQ